MILFISEYPGPDTERDGMMQRIAAIDSCFAGQERAYLKVSLVRNLKGERREAGPGVTVYRWNLFLHLPLIAALLARARVVYVHSVGNVLGLLPVYFLKRVVTDLHGAVPEELRMRGKMPAAWRYEVVEWVAARFSWRLVAVSSAMVDHIRAKHPAANPHFLTIPIFDDMPGGDREEIEKGGKTVVIFAGGTQPWQNVDLMMQAMSRTKDLCDFVVLTGDEAVFKRKAAEYGVEGNIEITGVPKQEVHRYLQKADLGFVLRDDVPVNRVSCPTKLVEYLSCGVVPIVIQPRIGDFADYGYSYIILDDFTAGMIPSALELQWMRQNNYRVITEMKTRASEEAERLVALCAES